MRVVALVLLLGCNGPFTEPVTIGGASISAAELNHGRERYVLNCYACHGDMGDGKGPASAFLRPPPRDFRDGVFKFGGVPAGQLPTDDNLVRLVRRGLTGTAMLPWDVSEEELHSIVTYIKTLSPRWKDEKAGDPVFVSPDPWKGKAQDGVAHGKRVYHATAQCARCHPSYMPKAELAALTKEVLGYDMAEISDEIYRPSLKDSQYKTKILPIDFLYHPIKTLSPKDTEEEALHQIYVSIAAGIGGTAMPMWKGALPEEDLWGLVHYVYDLAQMRDTKTATELRSALANQPPYVPPPVEAEKG